MGKKKKRERAAQQAALAAQQQAAAQAAAQQKAYQQQLSEQGDRYASLLSETQQQVADASKANIEAPVAQLVGGGIDEAERESRRRSRSRFGIAATYRASNRTQGKSQLG